MNDGELSELLAQVVDRAHETLIPIATGQTGVIYKLPDLHRMSEMGRQASYAAMKLGVRIDEAAKMLEEMRRELSRNDPRQDARLLRNKRRKRV